MNEEGRSVWQEEEVEEGSGSGQWATTQAEDAAMKSHHEPVTAIVRIVRPC
jgi:hypothetical protein